LMSNPIVYLAVFGLLLAVAASLENRLSERLVTGAL
jgi:hypothetical protein